MIRLNDLLYTLHENGVSVNMLIVDNLPMEDFSGRVFNKIITKYGEVTFHTDSTLKRKIIYQLQENIISNLSIKE